MPPPLFDEVRPDAVGRMPNTNPNNPTAGRPNGGFGYASANRDNAGNARGYSVGGGFFSSPVGNNGGRLDSLAAQAHIGGWRGENGDTNVGFNAEANGAKFTIPTGGIMGSAGRIDGEAFTANAGGYANSETASFGAGANIIAGSATVGNAEHQARFGLSAGVGAAGRAHYGDADGDGVRELGFGFDAGPFSLDIKSEALGHAANWAGNAASTVGTGISNAYSATTGAIGSAWDTVSSW